MIAAFCRDKAKFNATTNSTAIDLQVASDEFKSPFVLLGENIFLFIIGIFCMMTCLALLSMALAHFRKRDAEAKLHLVSRQFHEAITEVSYQTC